MLPNVGKSKKNKINKTIKFLNPDFMPVQFVPVDIVQVIDLAALAELHGQHHVRRVLVVHLRYL